MNRKTSLRVYRGLLRTLPPSFRSDFADDMVDLFADRLGETGGSPLRLGEVWLRALSDLARHGASEWLGALVAHIRRTRHGGKEVAMMGISQDFGYGLRSLRRSPGFTIVSLLMLGLGIGAATAMFSVVNAVLIKPLPFEDPDSLVMIRGRWPVRGVVKAGLSGGDLADFIRDTEAFEEFSALIHRSVPLNDGEGDAEQVWVASVTPNFFTMLGLDAHLGRVLAGDDPDGVLVIGHGLWQSRFGGDRSIIGKTLRVGNGSGPVVGVLPPGLVIPIPEQIGPPSTDTQVWTARSWDVDPTTANRNAYFLRVVARLKPDVAIEQAQREADVVAADHRRLYADAARVNTQFDVVTFHSQVVDQVERSLMALMLGVGFVLLIACANVANLLLVRSKAREGELAVRVALGAGRFRLLRQLLSESLILAVIGTFLGLAVAWGAVTAIGRLASEALPRIEGLGIDSQGLVFAVALTGVTMLLFGLLPAAQAVRASLGDGLRQQGGRGVGARRKLSRLLVAGEVALSLVLLLGAGLLGRSFIALSRVSPGFKAAGVLTFRCNLPRDQESELARRIEGLPGVVSVGRGPAPLTGRATGNAPFIPDNVAVEDDGNYPASIRRFVIPGYFRTLGIPLLQGRLFDERDVQPLGPNQPVQFRVIVDRRLADRIWPGENPVGRQLSRFVGTAVVGPWTVVGIVGDVHHNGLRDVGPGTIYFPSPRGGLFAIQAAVDPLDLVQPIRAQLKDLAPQVPLYDVRPMDAYVADQLAPARAILLLGAAFASVALLLAAIGLYGVISYAVGQRMHEMGIRLALGADRRAITRMIVGQGLRLALAGAAAGLVGALILTRLLRALLFGVTPSDPMTYVVIVLVLLIVASCASYLPARRAAQAEPSSVLRLD